MRFPPFVFLWCLLTSVGLVQAGPIFPAVIPFESIYYVTPPSPNGDQLVVGKFSSVAAWLDFYYSLLPLPAVPNEMFADSSIELAPGVYFTGVYVPTNPERHGDFSTFAGLLIDPLTNQPFAQNNILPASRIPDPFAIRVRDQAVPEPGTVTVTLLALAGILARRLRS